MDLQLAPGLEGAGGGAWMNQAMFRQAPVTLAVGANAQSIGLVRRLFAPLPPRSYCVLPLDAGMFLRRRGFPMQASAVAGMAVNAGWKLRNSVFAPRAPVGIQVEEAASVDSGWLEPLHAALPDRMACVVPSAEQLQWRLFGNPRARYRLYLAHQDDRCIGYLAARRTQSGSNAGDALHIIDWKLAAGSETAALTALLRHVVNAAQRQGCSKVYTTALAPRSATVFKSQGFLRGRADARLLMGLLATLPLPGMEQASAWHLTDLSFDSDGYF
ncbi:GNAT family N-acetyltransferase [Marilutibacter alkalisoli]|uniref:GNAT family N-acetyltransferase n=1 Tax=Marilutibacter alkalisoli TaxID=2591633 RepID=A0A514BRJ3_9GAMM|nr:GNAT family N-acetyltransferase [Lysobacter alkalisoli]QDH70014.1 GNAT family N-acetyltransferase [Lysobacter alkalisoli]